MVVCLKHVGITDSLRERLKISVKTADSWLAHALRTWPWTQSGPDALRGLIVLKIWSHLVHTWIMRSCCSPPVVSLQGRCCLPQTQQRRCSAHQVVTQIVPHRRFSHLCSLWWSANHSIRAWWQNLVSVATLRSPDVPLKIILSFPVRHQVPGAVVWSSSSKFGPDFSINPRSLVHEGFGTDFWNYIFSAHTDVIRRMEVWPALPKVGWGRGL